MSTEKVTLDVAREEVNKWLGLKRIPEAKRNTQAEAIESLAEGIAAGDLTIAEDGAFTHYLIFPISVAGIEISQLTYKPRMTAAEKAKATANTKPGDYGAMMMGYVRALTGKEEQIIGKLDSTDFSIATSIAIFFMI